MKLKSSSKSRYSLTSYPPNFYEEVLYYYEWDENLIKNIPSFGIISNTRKKVYEEK
jgi:hypothetical protein